MGKKRVGIVEVFDGVVDTGVIFAVRRAVKRVFGGGTGDGNLIAGEIGIVGVARPFKPNLERLVDDGNVDDKIIGVNISVFIIIAARGIVANGGFDIGWVRSLVFEIQGSDVV